MKGATFSTTAGSGRCHSTPSCTRCDATMPDSVTEWLSSRLEAVSCQCLMPSEAHRMQPVGQVLNTGIESVVSLSRRPSD